MSDCGTLEFAIAAGHPYAFVLPYAYTTVLVGILFYLYFRSHSYLRKCDRTIEREVYAELYKKANDVDANVKNGVQWFMKQPVDDNLYYTTADNGRGYNELHWAAYLCKKDNIEDLNKVARLLECGISVHQVDANGCTPLHHACKKGNLDLVLLLLKYGADPYALDGRSRYPIHHAVEHDHAEMLNVYNLMEAEIVNGSIEPDSVIPLGVYAVQCGAIECTKVLVVQQWDLSQTWTAFKARRTIIEPSSSGITYKVYNQAKDGLTALQYAVVLGNFDCFKALWKSQGTQKDAQLLKLAYQHGRDRIVDYIKGVSGGPNSGNSDKHHAD